MDEQKKPFEVTDIVNDILGRLKEAANILRIKISKININNTYKDENFGKRILAGFMIAVIIGLGYTGYKVNEIRTRAFDVYLGEHKLGSIRTQEEALETFEEVKSDLCEKYDADIVLDSKLTFEPTHAKDDDILTLETLKTASSQR